MKTDFLVWWTFFWKHFMEIVPGFLCAVGWGTLHILKVLFDIFACFCVIVCFVCRTFLACPSHRVIACGRIPVIYALFVAPGRGRWHTHVLTLSLTCLAKQSFVSQQNEGANSLSTRRSHEEQSFGNTFICCDLFRVICFWSVFVFAKFTLWFLGDHVLTVQACYRDLDMVRKRLEFAQVIYIVQVTRQTSGQHHTV